MSNDELVNKEIEAVLKKHNYQIGWQIEFPMYKILPKAVQLALTVLTEHGMKILFTLKPKK